MSTSTAASAFQTAPPADELDRRHRPLRRLVHPGPALGDNARLPRGSLMIEARIAAGHAPARVAGFDGPALAGLLLGAASARWRHRAGRGSRRRHAQRRAALTPAPAAARSCASATAGTRRAASGPLTRRAARAGDIPVGRARRRAHPMRTVDLHAFMTRPRHPPDGRRGDLCRRLRPGGTGGADAGADRADPGHDRRGRAPVHELRRGDLVVTDRGEQVPVLQVIRRTVPARGGFRARPAARRVFRADAATSSSPRSSGWSCAARTWNTCSGARRCWSRRGHLRDNVSPSPAHGPEMVTFHQLLLPGQRGGHGCGMRGRKPVHRASAAQARGPGRQPAGARSSAPACPNTRSRTGPCSQTFEALRLSRDRAA